MVRKIKVVEVRHGNKRSGEPGEVIDALDEKGVEQMMRVGRSLIGTEFGKVIVSPKDRARHSAEIILGTMSHPAVELEVEPDLDYEGRVDSRVIQGGLGQVLKDARDVSGAPSVGDLFGLSPMLCAAYHVLHRRAIENAINALPESQDGEEDNVLVIGHSPVIELGIGHPALFLLSEGDMIISEWEVDGDTVTLMRYTHRPCPLAIAAKK